MRRRSVIFCISAFLGTCITAHAQTCTPHFADMGPSAHWFAQTKLVVFDDGLGPTVYRTSALDPGILRWRNDRWEEMSEVGLPPDWMNYELFVLDDGTGPTLFVGGRLFTEPERWIYKWTGFMWDKMPRCLIHGSLVGGACSQLYAVPWLSAAVNGGPSRIYGLVSSNLVLGPSVGMWDGWDWVDIGRANGATSVLLFEFQHALYAWGDFTSIAGVPARGFAKWDGQQWTAPYPFGAGVSGLWAFAVHDDGNAPAVYTNQPVVIDGTVRYGVKKWDGSTFTFIGEPDPIPNGFASVNALASFDDGRGPALYICGTFASFEGVPARNIVRWDGTHFEPVGAGVYYDPDYLGAIQDVRGPALYIGGEELINAGGGTLQQSGVLLVGCPNCYADCDLSEGPTRLNVNDFVCFINKYAALDPYANCNVDAAIDIADFSCFMTKFAQGCP